MEGLDEEQVVKVLMSLHSDGKLKDLFYLNHATNTPALRCRNLDYMFAQWMLVQITIDFLYAIYSQYGNVS